MYVLSFRNSIFIRKRISSSFVLHGQDEDNLGEEKEEEDDIRRVGGDFIIKAIIPPWMMKTNMPQRVALEGDDNVFEWDDDDEEGAKLEIGDAPGTAGLFV